MARLPATGTAITMGEIATAFGDPLSNVTLTGDIATNLGYVSGVTTKLSDDMGGQDTASPTPGTQG